MTRTQALLLAGVAAACPTMSSSAPQPGDGRTFGFAMTYFYYDMYDKDPSVCPKGMNESFTDLYLASLPKEERDKLAPDTDNRLLFGKVSLNLEGKPMCHFPDGPVPAFMKPEFKVVQGHGKSYGLDLDGQDSRAGGKQAANGCGHEDFVGLNGEKGVDNQLYRVLGCTVGYRADSLAAVKMHTADIRAGIYNLLVEVSEVDDRQNDPDVTITYYSAADAGPFAAGVTPVPYRSVSAVSDRRFISSGKARIVNGVLTSDPIDFRFLQTPQRPTDGRNTKGGFYDRETYLRGSRIQAKFDDQGLSGTIGGYADVETWVENSMTFRKHPAFATGAAGTGKYSCPSMKVALDRYADGYRDPATGKCTAISAGYTFKAIPVFVIKQQTRTAAATNR